MRRVADAMLIFCLLLGLCACGQRVEEPEASSAVTTVVTTQETTTEASTKEETTEDISSPFDYTATKRIHDSLPVFTFTAHGHIDSEWARITAVEIEGEGFSQLLDTDFFFETELYGKHYLEFEDYDNDGFLDLRLQVIYNRNGPALFWLWDKSKCMFIENKQLQELNDGDRYPLGVAEDGRVLANPQKWEGNYYEYRNGLFVLVERYELDFTNDLETGITYRTTKTYKLVDGKLKLVSTTTEED